MKINKVYNLMAIGCIVFTYTELLSCRHNDLFPENIPDICFEREVLPIFQNSCGITGCHDNGNRESHYDLTNFIGISHSVVAGQPYKSPSYNAIIATTGENKMPPDKPLTIENRMIIRLWIEQGARLTSCPDTTSQPPDYVNPHSCFSRDILPILVSNCALAGCHNAATHAEGYVFEGYSTTVRAVRPGIPAESKLYEVITTLSGENRMPPSPLERLSSAEIDSIAAWIRYGALDEFCGETCDTINPVKFSATILPVVQKFCTGCHSGTAPGGGIRLENYANVSAVASGGILMNALKGNGIPKMPPAGTLSSCKIRQFDMWINDGYPNN
jgi:mono/diheme cytochrome c family protein